MIVLRNLALAAAVTALMTASPALAQHGRATGDEMVKAAQQALKDRGHDPGTVDGRMGPRTQAELKAFQKARGMPPTGRLDPKTMEVLLDSERADGGSATQRAAETK